MILARTLPLTFIIIPHLYLKVQNRLPLNIRGRTGLSGRGILGRYGPNHAADPIVTRWKRSQEGKIISDEETNKPILQFVSIQRRDTGEWAIPGGKNLTNHSEIFYKYILGKLLHYLHVCRSP